MSFLILICKRYPFLEILLLAVLSQTLLAGTVYAGHPLADRVPASLHDWNDHEKRILRSLSLFSLGYLETA